MENALKERLRRDPHSITIVFGTADTWLPPDSLIDLVKEFGTAENVIELQGIGHDAVISAKNRFWPKTMGLVVERVEMFHC